MFEAKVGERYINLLDYCRKHSIKEVNIIPTLKIYEGCCPKDTGIGAIACNVLNSRLEVFYLLQTTNGKTKKFKEVVKSGRHEKEHIASLKSLEDSLISETKETLTETKNDLEKVGLIISIENLSYRSQFQHRAWLVEKK